MFHENLFDGPLSVLHADRQTEMWPLIGSNMQHLIVSSKSHLRILALEA